LNIVGVLVVVTEVAAALVAKPSVIAPAASSTRARRPAECRFMDSPDDEINVPPETHSW
jgi:hypothetical protein